MEMNKLQALALAVLVAMLFASKPAMARYTSSNILCGISEKGLMACLPAIRASNPVYYPSRYCCRALTRANLPCLCAYRNSPRLPQLGIRPGLALQLPAKCKLPVPWQCR